MRFSQQVPWKHESVRRVLSEHQLGKPSDVRRIMSTHDFMRVVLYLIYTQPKYPLITVLQLNGELLQKI